MLPMRFQAGLNCDTGRLRERKRSRLGRFSFAGCRRSRTRLIEGLSCVVASAIDTPGALSLTLTPASLEPQRPATRQQPTFGGLHRNDCNQSEAVTQSSRRRTCQIGIQARPRASGDCSGTARGGFSYGDVLNAGEGWAAPFTSTPAASRTWRSPSAAAARCSPPSRTSRRCLAGTRRTAHRAQTYKLRSLRLERRIGQDPPLSFSSMARRVLRSSRSFSSWSTSCMYSIAEKSSPRFRF